LAENKHGLKRDIPEEVKREVRQRCGFGCVMCGNAIVEYEHFDPPFEHAREHNPNGIALLCPGCHGLISKGFGSKNKVREASNNPRCLIKGHTAQEMTMMMDNDYPVIVVGTTRWEKTTLIFEVLGEPLLEIEPPEKHNTPYLISGVFYDSEGNELFRIIKNEWIGLTSNWDITIIGTELTIRRKLRDIALQLKYTAPSDITITKIDMYYKGARIFGDKNGIKVIAPDKSTISIGNSGFKGIACYAAFSISSSGVATANGCQYSGW
jgi:hypothetical protein